MLPIDNGMIVNSIVEAFKRNGFETPQLSGKLQGANKLILSFNLPEVFSVGNDLLRHSLSFYNNNDGKHAFLCKIGVFRLVCSNGLQMPTSMGTELRIIHRDCNTSKESVRALPDLIYNAVSNRYEVQDVIEQMQATPILDLDHATAIVGNLNVSKRVKDSVIWNMFHPERVRPDLQNVNNAWTLVNLTNEVIRGVHGNTFTSVKANEKLLEDVILLAS
jgi:hypothetical protein